MATKEEINKVRDLFGLAHDLIAQAEFPGHVASKVDEALKFLAWQFNDFKQRGEALEKAEKAEAPAISAEAAKAGNPGENQPVSNA